MLPWIAEHRRKDADHPRCRQTRTVKTTNGSQLRRPVPLHGRESRRNGADIVLYRKRMKRHSGLIPLSWDHHDALVLAQGLILGQSQAPRSDWPTDRRAQVDRVIAFFAHTLRSHFEVEEVHLFPAVVTHVRGAADLVAQLVEEHDAMRTRIRDLERDPTTDLDVRLPSLGRLLEAHVRREERGLFETMQQEMEPADLETLGARLRGHAREGASCRVSSSSVADTR